MDPTIIALLGVIILMLTIKGAEMMFRLPNNEVSPAMERNAIASRNIHNANEAEACAVFEIRMTQQKMVDAGIIEAWEMSVCENEQCLNCYSDGLNGRRIPKYRPKRTELVPTKPTERKKNVRGEWHPKNDAPVFRANFTEAQKELQSKIQNTKKAMSNRECTCDIYEVKSAESDGVVTTFRADVCECC